MRTTNENSIKVLAVHLLNDYSGSPLVFANILKQMASDDHQVTLITNQGKGFLSAIPKVKYEIINYEWSPVKLITLLRFTIFQLILFFKVLSVIRRYDVLYINTMLPATAAIAARIFGKKVVVHLHETSVNPKSLKWLLKTIISRFSNKLIFVSDFLSQQENFGNVPRYIVPNSLSEDFLNQVDKQAHPELEQPRILMLCSLKEYKGVNVYVKLAQNLPQYQFDLVLNASQEQVDQYFDLEQIPTNMKLYPAQTDVHPFYKKASLVCNLSLPNQWVETFGMTALEAMAYGKPVIVPPVGGISEVVRDSVDGYHVDSRKTELLISKVKQVFTGLKNYRKLARNAKRQSEKFQFNRQYQSVFNILSQGSSSPITAQEVHS